MKTFPLGSMVYEIFSWKVFLVFDVAEPLRPKIEAIMGPIKPVPNKNPTKILIIKVERMNMDISFPRVLRDINNGLLL